MDDPSTLLTGNVAAAADAALDIVVAAVTSVAIAANARIPLLVLFASGFRTFFDLTVCLCCGTLNVAEFLKLIVARIIRRSFIQE
jgi:hypothetical protein